MDGTEGRRLQFGNFNQPIGFWVGTGIGAVALLTLLVFVSWYCCCFDRPVVIVKEEGEDGNDDKESERGSKGTSFFRLDESFAPNDSNGNETYGIRDDNREDQNEEADDDEDDEDDEDGATGDQGEKRDAYNIIDNEEYRDDGDQEYKDEQDLESKSATEQTSLIQRNDASDAPSKSISKKKDNNKSGKAKASNKKVANSDRKSKKSAKEAEDEECEVVITYDHCDVGESSHVFQQAVKKAGLLGWTFQSIRS